MKILQTALLLIVIIITSGCSHYSDITGKVIDNDSRKPIEGALVVAQWMKPRGMPGEQYHDQYKITETLTDKEGKFSLSGATGFLLDPPDMLIYKDGYIPWRNDSIFPSSNIVKKNEWNNNVTYKLNAFTNKYTFRQLYRFMDYGIKGSGGRETPIFDELMIKISKKEQAEIERDMLKKK